MPSHGRACSCEAPALISDDTFECSGAQFQVGLQQRVGNKIMSPCVILVSSLGTINKRDVLSAEKEIPQVAAACKFAN